MTVDMSNSQQLGNAIAHQILASEAQLIATLERHDKEGLIFYNPLVYAVDPHCEYVCKYGNAEKPVLFVGMSATPYGMAQTGVPFGNLKHIRDYINMDHFVIQNPKEAHPKIPITGWDTLRTDQEGERFWRFFEQRYGAKELMRKCYMTTYCPAMYVDAEGKEITPPCLPHKLRNAVINCCDLHIIDVVDIIKPSVIIAVGGFTYEQVGKLFCSRDVGPQVHPMLHPSPNNSVSFKKWTNIVNDQLIFAGVPQLIAGSEYLAPSAKEDKKKKRCSRE